MAQMKICRNANVHEICTKPDGAECFGSGNFREGNERKIPQWALKCIYYALPALPVSGILVSNILLTSTILK